MPRISQQSTQSTIVVGIDGTEDGLRAVDYAAAEARSTGAHVLLVHVIALTPASMTISRSSEARLAQAGERVVQLARLRALFGGVPARHIRVQVVPGPITSALIKESKQARLLVLGRRGLSGLDRLFAGSTSTSVGARAECPVVVVPHAWSSDGPYARVVVGVDGSARSLPALAMAVAEASSRSAELVVVHAWEAPAPYYVDASEIAELVDSCRRTAELAVAETLAGWSERHPDITITRVFETRHPVEALVAHSAEADLLGHRHARRRRHPGSGSGVGGPCSRRGQLLAGDAGSARPETASGRPNAPRPARRPAP